MADSVLVAVTKAISAALEVARAAGSFEISALTVGWDFEGRPDDIPLSDTTGYLTVAVPRKYDEIDLESQNGIVLCGVVRHRLAEAVGARWFNRINQ